MPTPCHQFFPFTFDLLVTNGHSSEQVSVWDDGQPDDCVCETFCAAPLLLSSFQEAVSNRALLRLLLSFAQTFLFVDNTLNLFTPISLGSVPGNFGQWAMNNGQLSIWHIVANCR